MEAGRARRPEIDRLKGLAILGVMLIHAQPLVGTFVGDRIVNRAVPVFLVLFGMTSELWWAARGSRRGSLREWYAGRARRLFVPLWSALALWWILVAALDLSTATGPGVLVASALGYLPWIGTGWFVTLVLLLVALFPPVRAAVDRLSAPRALALAAAATVVSYLCMFEINAAGRWLLLASGPQGGLGGFFYFWIFPPARAFAIVGGIVLARRAALDGRLVAASVLALAAGWTLSIRWLDGPRAVEAVAALLDVPLTIVLLALVACPLPGAAARALAWCGVASWGLYLAQMVIHDGLHAALAVGPSEGTPAVPWGYFALLGLGSVALVLAGASVRHLLGRWDPRLG